LPDLFDQKPDPAEVLMSSSYNVGADRAAAAAKVNGPAIGLMVTAGVGMLAQLAGIIAHLAGVGMAGLSGAGGSPEAERIQAMMSGGLGIVSGVIGIIVGVVVLLGAMKMKNLTSYGFAMTSAILAMIPCISPCCCLGIPIGIWAIVALVDQNVKNSFV
jgi:hypothetical protein